MEIKQSNKGEQRLCSKFEPSRLAHEILAQAYEKIVPQKVRVYPSQDNKLYSHAKVFEIERRGT